MSFNFNKDNSAKFYSMEEFFEGLKKFSNNEDLEDSSKISFLNIIFKKNNNINGRTKIDCFIYDEVIRNIRVYDFVKNELGRIKKIGKGNEVLSSMAFFNMILSNNEREIIKIMNVENAKDFFIYALQKETYLKKSFPFIVEYIDKVQAGIEK